MNAALDHSMPELPSIDETIGNHARALSEQLQAMSLALFPPASQKELRRFSSGEAAKLIRVSIPVCDNSLWLARALNRI